MPGLCLKPSESYDQMGVWTVRLIISRCGVQAQAHAPE